MKKIILDTTFTIPVRIDSPERSRNLDISIKYLNKYFYSNILIGEDSGVPQLKKFSKTCGYIHYKNDSDTFHRTKILNDLARASCSPFIVNFDSDIIIPPNQLLSAIEILRKGKADMVLPYGGMAINILGENNIKTFRNTLNIRSINKKETEEMNVGALGGAVLWNKEAFFKFGMENENFIGWGKEDLERMRRAKKLGLRVFRVPGNLYHLDHPRNESNNVGQKFYSKNTKELEKVQGMKKIDLEDYIKNWEWV